MHKDYEHLQHLRDALERETNRSVLPKSNPDLHKKSISDKKELKLAKSRYSVLKENKISFNQSRNELILIIGKSSPKWGSATIGLI